MLISDNTNYSTLLKCRPRVTKDSLLHCPQISRIAGNQCYVNCVNCCNSDNLPTTLN